MSPMKLYLRCKNIPDVTQNVTINIRELEKIYISSIIEEIYIMHIDDPRSDEKDQSRPMVVAVVVSQAGETSVLEELETTSRLNQLDWFKMLQAVLIEKESLRIVQGSRLKLLENIDREYLENQYRTKVTNILLKHENINDEIIDIHLNTMEQQHLQMTSPRLLMEEDMILDPALQLSVKTINKTDFKDILLTGSTGFLGAYLLGELLKQTGANIYCLVRLIPSQNASHARVFYLQGDLAVPHLGLDDDQYSMLASNIRSIYHCGAAVNFLKPYAELRSANVLGTLELIKLSCLSNCRINFISTLSVLDNNDQNGYVQTKQVAEHLLEQAIERNLSVTIFRPGFISWCSSTGDFNKMDWISQLFVGMIQFGSAPDSNCMFEITPVDQMSRTIIQLGESQETLKTEINLSHTHRITFKAIWTEICQQQKIQPDFIDVQEWFKKLNERVETDSQSLRGLQLFSSALVNYFSEDAIPITETQSDLNLPLFVKALLQHQLSLSMMNV